MSRRLYGPSTEEPEEPEEWEKSAPTPPPTNPLLVAKELTKTQIQTISQESIEVARAPLQVVPAKPAQELGDKGMGETAITATKCWKLGYDSGLPYIHCINGTFLWRLLVCFHLITYFYLTRLFPSSF
jgi:hypothetical protein